MMWSFESAAALNAKAMRTEFMAILHAHADAARSDFEAAELIYAELIGNAIRHAPGRVTVGLRWKQNDLQITVHDTLRTFAPDFSLPENALEEGGRGLFIVKQLAKSVRVRSRAGNGSEIVAVLPVTRKPSRRGTNG